MNETLKVLGNIPAQDWGGRDRFFIIGTDPRPYIHAYVSEANETHPDAERFHFTPEDAVHIGSILIHAGYLALGYEQ